MTEYRIIKGADIDLCKANFCQWSLRGIWAESGCIWTGGVSETILAALTDIGSDESNARDEAFYVQGQYDLKNPYISPMLERKEGLSKALMIMGRRGDAAVFSSFVNQQQKGKQNGKF